MAAKSRHHRPGGQFYLGARGQYYFGADTSYGNRKVDGTGQWNRRTTEPLEDDPIVRTEVRRVLQVRNSYVCDSPVALRAERQYAWIYALVTAIRFTQMCELAGPHDTEQQLTLFVW